MYYDTFQEKIDHLIEEIISLRKNNELFEADKKKLELIYVKINYYEDAVSESVKFGRPANKSLQDSLDCALREIGNWRDYMYETYQYEEN